MTRRRSSRRGVIPLSAPDLAERERRAVNACLASSFISSVGDVTSRFERAVADYVGVPYAVATVSGTAALHLALMVAGVGADDEVLVPAISFVAPANAVRYVGAFPVFIDVDPDFGQMDPTMVERFLISQCRRSRRGLRNRSTGRVVKAILAVDALGHPCDADALARHARRYGLIFIEDAAAALGGEYRGRKAGSLGDIACVSFNGNKTVTTGGGGMLLTRRRAWAEAARHLATQARRPGPDYLHDRVGFNYRLPAVLAAIGLAQMERLSSLVAAKRRIAAAYRKAFSSCRGLSLMPEAPWAKTPAWLSTVRVTESFGRSNRDVQRRLAAAGIESRLLWHPLPDLPMFRSFQTPSRAQADRLHREALSLPSSVSLSAADQRRVIRVVLAAGT